MAAKRMTRRRFLQYFGVTTVAVAGGLVWRAADQGVFDAGEGPAFEAWETWRTDMSEGPLALVRAGILAANPHNTQPWLFRITPQTIELYADTQRHLGTMDPFLREMHLGLGCAVENMVLAAEAFGYEVDLSLEKGRLSADLAGTGMRRVATLALAPASRRPPDLYEAIPNRRTNRYPYTGEALADGVPNRLQELNTDDDVRIFLYPAGSPAFEELKEGTETGVRFIVNDEQMAHDSYAWFPLSWDEMQRDKAGIYIDTAGVSPLLRTVVKMVPGMPSQSAVDSSWVTDTTHQMETASAVGIIAVRSLYDVPQTLRAGRLWQRIHLSGTALGLALQPHNEMPEVVDRERQLDLSPRMAERLAGITRDASWHPTFIFRLGRSTVHPLPSPRRPVTDVVLS
ncbi:MAG: Acg family FMN-binding oxidoreductase [Anaerolineales bacterium]